MIGCREIDSSMDRKPQKSSVCSQWMTWFSPSHIVSCFYTGLVSAQPSKCSVVLQPPAHACLLG